MSADSSHDTLHHLLHLVAQQHQEAVARQTREFEAHRRELSRRSPEVAEIAAARAEAARQAVLAQMHRGPVSPGAVA